MAKCITSEQLEEIMAASERGLDEYNEVLRQIAGIEAREYTTYQYFDEEYWDPLNTPRKLGKY